MTFVPDMVDKRSRHEAIAAGLSEMGIDLALGSGVDATKHYYINLDTVAFTRKYPRGKSKVDKMTGPRGPPSRRASRRASSVGCSPCQEVTGDR